jgi:hypothetical protein
MNLQEQEEPNDSEVEPNEDFPQTSKVNKETAGEGASETQALPTSSSADEEAVNKVAEKIDTLRMGPRQVRKSKAKLFCFKLIFN